MLRYDRSYSRRLFRYTAWIVHGFCRPVGSVSYTHLDVYKRQGYIRFFFQFTLPLSTPILATVGTFVFVQSWNNYLLPLVVVNSRDLFTWPLGMMQFRGEYIVEWNKILAFVSLTIFPAIVFFISAQKYIVAGLTRGSVKG